MWETISRELRLIYLAFGEGDPIRAVALAEVRGRARLAHELGMISDREWSLAVERTAGLGDALARRIETS